MIGTTRKTVLGLLFSLLATGTVLAIATLSVSIPVRLPAGVRENINSLPVVLSSVTVTNGGVADGTCIIAANAQSAVCDGVTATVGDSLSIAVVLLNKNGGQDLTRSITASSSDTSLLTIGPASTTVIVPAGLTFEQDFTASALDLGTPIIAVSVTG